MKTLKRITVVFTVLMLIALAVFAAVYLKSGVKISIDTTYTDEQLQLYKEVHGDLDTFYRARATRQFVYVLIFWGVMLLSGYGLIWAVYQFFLKPAKGMEDIATEIAKGNLDVNIPMQRNNIFGSFTESFDMMRDELRSSRKREIEAQKAKEEMVAELSHDLKTPVATITATCEVLDMKCRKKIQSGSGDEIKDAEDTLEKIGYISDKANIINGITDNLFRATVDGTEEIAVNPEETISTVIEDLLGNYRGYAEIIMEDHIPECLVLMDKLRMEQVIDNIIGNSLKYAGTAIRVNFEKTEKDAEGRSFVKITIRDGGKGVDPEDLPLIAEKFKRGKNASDKSGYGLGLWLVNYYMEKQGGGMNYYNDNGFVVELLIRKV